VGLTRFDARAAKALAAGDHLTIEEAPASGWCATVTRAPRPSAGTLRLRKERAAKAARATYTVRGAADDWLTAYRGTVTPKAFAEAERLLRTEIDPIARMLVVNVTRKTAFDLIDAKRDTPVVAGNPSTTESHLPLFGDFIALRPATHLEDPADEARLPSRRR
jgi:hypothetical protein